MTVLCLHVINEFHHVESKPQHTHAFSSTHTDTFLGLSVPADIKDTIHLWPVDVMRLERAQASPRALVPMSVLVGVCACECVHTPLWAVIHGGLFQTMPLYLSPFILAAGCLRAAGAL